MNYSLLSQRLNSEWHETGLRLFMVVVLSHWAEHLVQAVQIFIWHWPRAEALGVLGMAFPWLVQSELMHYLYALVMLIGIWIFRTGFSGRSHFWWTITLWIQFWHHVEHLLLQAQWATGHNLFNSPVPMSIAQLWIPRVELHLLYNTLVFVPMIMAMYYHLFPSREESLHMRCTCAWHARATA